MRCISKGRSWLQEHKVTVTVNADMLERMANGGLRGCIIGCKGGGAFNGFCAKTGSDFEYFLAVGRHIDFRKARFLRSDNAIRN